MSSFPDCVPVLRDGPVTLRAHRESDLPRIVDFANDPRSTRWVRLPRPYGEAQAREFCEAVRANWQTDGGPRQWAIEVDGTFAGSIGLDPHASTTAELGFGAHPDVRGRGVMTRTVRLLVAHGFDDLGLRTIVWRAAVGNWASRRVAWASGFTIDGVWPAMHPTGVEVPDDLWFGHLHADEPREPAHPWFTPTVLEAADLRLRPWRDTDRPPTIDDDLRRFFLGGMSGPPPLAVWCRMQRERMASGEGVFWCLADADTDEPLGHVQVIRLNQPKTAGTGLLGYFLDPRARGRGLVQQALDRLLPHAFAPRPDGGLGLHRLQAGTDADNTASQRTLRRAGFRLAATERAVLAQPDGTTAGALTFELLARDDRAAARVVPRSVPTLPTRRLTLRAWREKDRPRPDQRLDVASALYMPAGAQPTTETFDAWLHQRRALQDTRKAVTWCVADADTDAALGSIGIFGFGDGTPTNAEIGYWMHTDARGHGYLTEALAAVVTVAFASEDEGGLGLTRLHAGTDLDNVASQQVLEKAGFHRWGVDHQAFTRADGTYSDGAYYELLADDLATTD